MSVRIWDQGCEKEKSEKIGNGPNTVSESTVSNSKLSEVLWPSPSSGQRAQ